MSPFATPRPLLRLDWTMVLAMLALFIGGLFFIYSASYRAAELPVSPLYQKQLRFGLVGLGAFIAMALLDYRRLRDLAWPLYLVGLVGLALVLVPGIGKKMYGAVRWITLAGTQVQPSELAKLATILVLARFMSNPSREPAQFRFLCQAFVIALPPVLLILREPDLSTASTLLGVTLIMLFAAGVPLRTFVILMCGGGLVVGALLALLFLKPDWVPHLGYVKERIVVFFDPGRDPLKTGWNAIQSALAVGSGGLWGKGYLIRVIKRLSPVGKKHKPPSPDLEVTFKSILPDFNAVMAAPMQVAGAEMTKGKAEENIGAGPRHTLSSYIEKTATIVVPPGKLGDLTLGDFAKFLPELAGLGIPAGTKLQGTRAYTVEMDPGTVQLAGSAPCKIRLEGWSAKPGEKPYLYNVSVKYGCEDFYGSAQIHAAGEQFMAKALQEGLADVALADEGKWCGSSVRKLMNRPMAQ